MPCARTIRSDEHDEFTPISDARLMHERIRDSTLAIIDGAAHMPNLERDDDFKTALEAFLNDLSA